MNKATVKALQQQINELERVVDELTEELKRATGSKPPAWFYRRDRHRLADSQNSPPRSKE